jgi:hypothetical protein
MSNSDENSFSGEGIENVVAFSEILRRVHMRLMAEGYVIQDGHVLKIDLNPLGEYNEPTG